MAEPDRTGERTEQPTRRRLDEARRKGMVPRSADLTAAVLALGAMALLAVAAPTLLAELQRMTAELLGRAGHVGTGAPQSLWRAAAPAVGTLGLVCAALAVLAVGVNVLQVGFLATGEPLKWNLGRLWPGGRRGGVFSGRSAMRLVMTLAKSAGVALAAVLTIRPAMPRIVAATGLSGAGIAAEAGRLVALLGVRIGLVLLALAGLDWLYQRARHRRDLMMTRRELQDELKHTQGGLASRRRREDMRIGAAGPAGEDRSHG